MDSKKTASFVDHFSGSISCFRQTHFDSRFAQQFLYALPARFIEKEGKNAEESRR
jgi:hypothetical protein